MMRREIFVEEGPVYPDGSVTPNILTAELNRIGYSTLEPRILNAADYEKVPTEKKQSYFLLDIEIICLPLHIQSLQLRRTSSILKRCYW